MLMIETISLDDKSLKKVSLNTICLILIYLWKEKNVILKYEVYQLFLLKKVYVNLEKCCITKFVELLKNKKIVNSNL